ncbi:MAG: FMN-binding protein [Sphaerochaeta sp.]|uniref:FMN-binding protein n=1 Tax=Sphaerochaeta sp. TaxID=1972642 RepID=UPI002FC6E090
MKQKTTFFQQRIYPLTFMLAVTIACILPTAFLHLATQEKATSNELSFTRRAILQASGVTFANTPSGIEQAYLNSITAKDGYYIASTPGGKRYVIPAQGPGLWGTISIMAGFEEDGKTLSGIAIVSQSETPGLGARIEEPWFTAQFKGMHAPFSLAGEGATKKAGEVDGITGATRTSEFFRNLVNKVSKDAPSIIQGA